MTPQKQIQFIRQKCIEANRDIAGECLDCGRLNDGENCAAGGFHSAPRPIRLADVLLAIAKNANAWSVSSCGAFEKWEYKSGEWLLDEYTGPLWNLRKDSLEDQSGETISFLYSLLK